MKTRWGALLLIMMLAVVMASANDVKKSMVTVIPVQTAEKEVNLLPSAELRAGDWVAAWNAAREACPDAQEIRIYFKDRPTTSIKAPNVLECTDIKARGQVLLITVRKTDTTEESVIIVPASEVLRLETVKKPAR